MKNKRSIAGINFLLVTVCLGLSCVTGQKPPAPTEAPAPKPLELTLNPGEEKFLGNIWTSGQNEDPYFIQLWNQISPENAGKWGCVEGTRNVMLWRDLDNAYNLAKEKNFPFRLHVLIWGNQQPEWINALPLPDQLAEIEEWMSLLAERYPEMEFIDVVNEPLHAPPSYKEALGGDGATGWDWVIKSFELARKYFPQSELQLNDYSITASDADTMTYQQIIKLLQARNLIDCIGLQGHFLENIPLATISRNMDKLAALGLPIYLSELDVEFLDDSLQAMRMKDLFSYFWEHEAVKGVTFWGYRENMVWRKRAFLVRKDGTPRPALEWLAAYLRGEDYVIPLPKSGIRYGSPDGNIIEAESFNKTEGMEISGRVVSLQAGNWALYEKVALKPEYTRLRVVYAHNMDTPLTIHLKFASLDGEKAASVELPPPDSGEDFAMVDIPWNPREGVFDVFLESGGEGNIDYLEFHIPY